MKAKEYFEKYFTDLDTISAEEVMERVLTFMKDMSLETIDICEARHSLTDSCVDGALKDQNNKFNAVGNLIEKKYGRPLLKRNSFIDYWNRRFKQEIKK